MPQSPPDEDKSRRSVLQLIEGRTGVPSKVMLSDMGSEHGASPVIDPNSAASKLVPHVMSRGSRGYRLPIWMTLKPRFSSADTGVTIDLLPKSIAGL